MKIQNFRGPAGLTVLGIGAFISQWLKDRVDGNLWLVADTALPSGIDANFDFGLLNSARTTFAQADYLICAENDTTGPDDATIIAELEGVAPAGTCLPMVVTPYNSTRWTVTVDGVNLAEEIGEKSNRVSVAGMGEILSGAVAGLTLAGYAAIYLSQSSSKAFVMDSACAQALVSAPELTAELIFSELAGGNVQGFLEAP